MRVEEPKGGEVRGSLTGPMAGVPQKKPEKDLEELIRQAVEEAIARALSDFEGTVHEITNNYFEELKEEIYNYYGEDDDEDEESTVIRKAYVKTTPGAVATVVCYLDTDATGPEVTVTCSIINGTALNSAIPRITDGDEIKVYLDGSTWRCVDAFQTSEDCDCYSE